MKPIHHRASRGLSRFIVLIEARMLGLAMTMLLIAALFSSSVHAQSVASSKVAADLRDAISASITPRSSWTRDVAGTRYVKALVVSNSSDSDLTELRAQVLAAGGSVYYRYMSVTALSVLLPAARVDDIAARADVQSISPNRLTARTASALEMATGATSVRTTSGSGYAGLDGSGVGIAILDSGIAWNHLNLRDAEMKKSRVARAVDFQRVGDATASGVKDWTPGIDVSASLYAGGDGDKTMSTFEKKIAADRSDRADLYGHGSHVAGVAAGRGAYQAQDATGIAPNATLFDVKVLDSGGYGQLSDVLAGIDWVIYHAKEYGIRVMNLSLAADSTESYLTDPLCRAVRSATAAGITVVVAAGNYGQASNGAERYGTISAPGNDPTVITVGAVNTHGTPQRSDDSVNFFSSRGPTRGSTIDANGQRRVDNLLKPDLVAPGNKVVSVLASDKTGAIDAWSYLPANYPVLSAPFGGTAQPKLEQLMNLSGTSIAAPVVSGTVALMLQANPGLTPPLIKAMLQYSAQPLAGANLLQQGAGLLNVDGAVRLASIVRTDLASAIRAGSIAAGDSMLAPGKSLPIAMSVINGASVSWSRIVFAGGSHLLSGAALFTQYQPIYDPRLVWVRTSAQRLALSYWPAASGEAPDLWMRSITAGPVASQRFVGAGVVWATSLAGSSSLRGGTGAFTPAATLASWLASGSGVVLSEGIVLSEGVVLSEGIVLSEISIVGEP